MNAGYTIHTQLRRALARHIGSAFPGLDVQRSLIPEPPTADKITVLPGLAPGTITEVALGMAPSGRAFRDDAFTTRVWIEVLRDDLEACEDAMDSYRHGIEDIIARGAGLDDIPGLTAFGEVTTMVTHDPFQPMPGRFYQWVEMETSAAARYD